MYLPIELKHVQPENSHQMGHFCFQFLTYLLRNTVKQYTANEGNSHSFLACDSMLSALYAIARPSVRLSVTQVDQSKTVEVRVTQFSPYSSPSFSCLRYKFHPEIPMESPQAMVSNKGGLGKRANIVVVLTLSPGGSTS